MNGFQVAVVGLVVAVAALAVAITGPPGKWWRARRARKAEERKKREARFHIPELGRILEDLAAAIETGDPQTIRYNLDRWRLRATTVCGILSADQSGDQGVHNCLKRTIKLARDASTALLKGDRRAKFAYLEALKVMTAAFDRLNRWVGR